jgi:hypothetical protein
MEYYLTADEIEIARKNGFDEKGLRYPIEELQRLEPKNLSMEEMEKYVDAITFIKVRAGDVQFFASQLNSFPSSDKPINVSATGLGNLAYVARHLHNSEIQDKAVQIFTRLTTTE